MLARIDALPPAASWAAGLLTGGVVVLGAGHPSALWVASFVPVLAFVAVRGAGLWPGSQRVTRPGAMSRGALASIELAVGMVVIMTLASRWLPMPASVADANDSEALGTLHLDLGSEHGLDDSSGSGDPSDTTGAGDMGAHPDETSSSGATSTDSYDAIPPDDSATGGVVTQSGDDGSVVSSVSPSDSGSDRCPGGMVLIEGGRFSAQGNKHSVKPFCLDVTEVRVADYRRCVDVGKRGKPGCTLGGGKRIKTTSKPGDGALDTNCHLAQRANRDAHPINCVEWFQAKDYCQFVGKRLPTEWEWEWAARGRTKAHRYPWGNQPQPSCDMTVKKDCGGMRPVGAASRDSTPEGVKDMGGNVEEWTSTAPSGRTRIIRGGSWFSGNNRILTSNRQRDSPHNSYHYVGFRCADDPKADAPRASASKDDASKDEPAAR